MVRNTTWRSTWIVGFVLEQRKIARNSSFPRSPDRMILQLVLAMVCGALISPRAGAVDESYLVPEGIKATRHESRTIDPAVVSGAELAASEVARPR